MIAAPDDDDMRDALAARIQAAVMGEEDSVVLGELLCELGETIGRMRAAYRGGDLLQDTIAHLTQYVSEIPP